MIALLTLVAATSIAAEGPCDILNAAGNPYGRLLWLCSSFAFISHGLLELGLSDVLF